MAEWVVTFLLVAGIGIPVVWALTHPTPSKHAGLAPTEDGTPGPAVAPPSPSRRPGLGPLPTTWEERPDAHRRTR